MDKNKLKRAIAISAVTGVVATTVTGCSLKADIMNIIDEFNPRSNQVYVAYGMVEEPYVPSQGDGNTVQGFN